MFKLQKITKDSTIYKHLPELNAGVDPQLELIKYRVGDIIPTQSFEFEEWPTTSYSRILLDFDISGLTLGDHYLLLHVSTMAELSDKNININVHRILDSWSEGFGNRNDFPYINSGVTWISNGTTNWSDPYLSGDYISHAIKYTDEIVKINISDLINSVINNSLEWNGLAIKLSDEDSDLTKYEIRFYGSDTQSIFEPTIVSYSADSVYAGDFDPAIDVDFLNYDIIATNIKRKYTSDDTILLKIKATKLFQPNNYTNTLTTSTECNFNGLYQIVDSVTGKIIVPFNNIGTQIQKSDQGYIIKFKSENLILNRFYSIQIKLIDGDDFYIHDNNINFLIQ